MFATLEVRWFGAGSIPAAVLAWFQGGAGVPILQPGRVDHYLRLTDTPDSLGLKLRQGNIEIKQRSRTLGTLHLHTEVVGVVEGWHKWSFPLADAASLAGLMTPTTAWIAVEKRRQLCRYRRDQDQIMPVAPDEFMAQGCILELSRLRAINQDWWSLCLETFGAVETLHDTFFAVANYLFSSTSLTLEAGHSFGYPKWLASLNDD